MSIYASPLKQEKMKISLIASSFGDTNFFSMLLVIFISRMEKTFQYIQHTASFYAILPVSISDLRYWKI